MSSPHDRLSFCWSIWSCDVCTYVGCGWCPVSSTCIPASSILDPLRKENICPLRSERFELRTETFGCGCSTITFLSVLVTILATAIGLLVLYGTGVALRRFNRNFGTGTWTGHELEIKNDGSRVERRWRRGNWFTRLISGVQRDKLDQNKSEQEQVTERSRLLG